MSDAADTPIPENPSDTIRGTWNFSLDDIRTSTTHYTPAEQEILIRLFRWCVDPLHPMRREDAARRIGISTNLIYQLLTGVYRSPDKSLRGPSSETIEKIKEFLALEAKRFESGKTQFVLTPTAKKIFTGCELARESQTPVIMWGNSHVGKTWALRQFAADNNHGKTHMAELEAASNYGGLMRTLALAVDIRGAAASPVLYERVKNALSPNVLFIIDEMHLLKHTARADSFFKCVEAIRRLWDASQCGMVLTWTNLANLKHASQAELVQVWRRGVHKVALPNMPTKADIGMILYANGLTDGEPVLNERNKAYDNCLFPSLKLKVEVKAGRHTITESPYEILRQLAKNSGLKAITERIRYARKLANRGSTKLAWEHFCDAHLRIEKQAEAEAEGEWI